MTMLPTKIRDPSSNRRPVFPDLFAFLLLLCGLTWLMAKGMETLGYPWQWYRVPRYILTFGKEGLSPGPILEGLFITVKIVSIDKGVVKLGIDAPHNIRVLRSELIRAVEDANKEASSGLGDASLLQQLVGKLKL